MKNTLTVAAKEFRGYFTSPVAYVVIFGFLFVSGLIFVLTVTMPQAQTSNYGGVLQSMVFITLLMTPMLTMSLVALERQRGTLELLMPRPISDWSIIAGKYLAAVGLYVCMLIVTLLFPVLMSVGGTMEWGPVLSGYLGVLCAGLAFLAIGVFGSSVTADQVSAALGTIGLLLLLWIIGFVGQLVPGRPGDVLTHLSFIENFKDFASGVIDTKNVVYFLSMAGFFLFLCERIVESRRNV
jgi:ABC-2 type transport system permease protein